MRRRFEGIGPSMRLLSPWCLAAFRGVRIGNPSSVAGDFGRVDVQSLSGFDARQPGRPTQPVVTTTECIDSPSLNRISFLM